MELLRLDKSFVAEPDAARAARHSLEHLHEALPASTTSRLSLLVTELVANAVIHGSSKSSDPVGVRAWTSPQAILVEVTANGPGFSWDAPAPGGMAVGGWGLVLVEREADRWGIQAGPPTTVWFQIDSILPAGRESVIEQ